MEIQMEQQARMATQEENDLLDTIRKLEARVVELEQKLETTIQRAQWDLEWRIDAEATTRKLDDCINEAVKLMSLFETRAGWPFAREVKRALSLLRKAGA